MLFVLDYDANMKCIYTDIYTHDICHRGSNKWKGKKSLYKSGDVLDAICVLQCFCVSSVLDYDKNIY